MKRGWLVLLLGLALLAVVWIRDTKEVQAQATAGLDWIWFDEGDPTKTAPAETRYFRKSFAIDRAVDEATLEITADNEFTAWVNGVEVGKGDDWKRVRSFDVRKHLDKGKNAIAVQARNQGGSAGLLVKLSYVPNGQSKLAQVSDESWKASKTEVKGWQEIEFDDSKWTAAKVLGAYGKVGPWQGLVWDAGGNERFKVPPGFVVEMVAGPNPNYKELDPKLPFSLINLTFDAKGRLLVAQERGPILLCTDPDVEGVFLNVKPYCTQVKNCQGMCWVKDALLLVGEQDVVVQGKLQKITGLFRVRDTDGDDKTDEVQLLHKFKGGMAEHGPHAIIHGPDNWLYLVIGNHAWAQPDKLADHSPLRRWPTGGEGIDQGRPDTTEDVLLPRQNDSRGHAANRLAPGGTIWRLDHDGKNMSLVTAGFRNHYDAAFNPHAELFTFDSDMEWDEALPWYRAVRVCHCPPGADFVWRTGAANTPDYYLDSLPPILETGRGSPVGVEFYDHEAFPEKYRGAFFMADWAIGVIFAVHLERDGAGFKAEGERFCSGSPMNVTDVMTGPDGALYFTMGGRGSQGGVFRIVHEPQVPVNPNAQPAQADPFNDVQPLAAWSRARKEAGLATFEFIDKEGKLTKKGAERFTDLAQDKTRQAMKRINWLNTLQTYGPGIDSKVLLPLAQDKNADVRAHAIWLLGVNEHKEAKEALVKALLDDDALVRRRACEALIRAGIEPPVEALVPLLDDRDRYVRTAARLVLQRIDPKKWADKLWENKREHIVLEGIIALCKTNQAIPYTEPIFGYLHDKGAPRDDVQGLLDYLRTLQMALIHTTQRPGGVRGIALECLELFPHQDWRVNRELAILLTYFRREKILDEPVHAKLLEALVAGKNDRPQQIHYFYCLRLLHEGWTPEQKSRLLAWYDSTKTWEGGHSFTPFLENILRDLNPIFTAEDRSAVFAQADKLPWATAAMLRFAPPQQAPSAKELFELYDRLSKAGKVPKAAEIKESILNTLGQARGPEAQAALRKIADSDPTQHGAVARLLAGTPSAENFPYLIKGLTSNNPPLSLQLVQALKKCPTKPALQKEPKAEDAVPYRAVLLASRRLEEKDRWKVVELLRHWSNHKQFGAEEGDWKRELASWAQWFSQTFPQEPPLPDVTVAGTQSKWKFDELLAYLDKDPKGKNGDALKGKVVFEKANCIKCHKFGSTGEGIGPDLTTVKSRFKRADILDTIQLPSKVISDQYRGTVIITKKGMTLTGLAAVQGDTVTVLQLDGTKVMMKTDEIDQQFASTVSAMPEKLLDDLTLQEIADLFAYLESEPPK